MRRGEKERGEGCGRDSRIGELEGSRTQRRIKAVVRNRPGAISFVFGRQL